MAEEKRKRCVIVTAGEAGDYAAMRARLRQDDCVLAADGGVRHLGPLGVKPDLLLGDFDSSPRPRDAGVPVQAFRPEKDDTDTMLCVREGLRRGAREFLILCPFGGRLDHTLANLSTLLFVFRHGARGTLFDGRAEATLVQDGSLTLPRRENVYVSVFPLGGPAEGVCERGLFYPLCDAVLTPEFPIGVSNRFTDAPQATISVRRGTLLVLLVPREKTEK